MRRPVVGIISNSHRIENRFHIQGVGERNLRAVAEVSGAIPLMFPSIPEITDVSALLDIVDGVVLTGARANVHPTRFNVDPAKSTSPTTSIATMSRWRMSKPASRVACRCSASAVAFRR